MFHVVALSNYQVQHTIIRKWTAKLPEVTVHTGHNQNTEVNLQLKR